MPIPYKQFDRTNGTWVTKYKDVSIIETRRPIKMVVEPKKKEISTQKQVIGIFRSTTQPLTREDVLFKMKGVNENWLRRIIYLLCKMGVIIKSGSIINNNGNRCHQFKIKAS